MKKIVIAFAIAGTTLFTATPASAYYYDHYHHWHHWHHCHHVWYHHYWHRVCRW
jgi:hypothetical protein